MVDGAEALLVLLHDAEDARGARRTSGQRLSGMGAPRPDGQRAVLALKGRLLLIHGTMDNNVPLYNTLLVADALIKGSADRVEPAGHERHRGVPEAAALRGIGGRPSRSYFQSTTR